MSKWSTHHALNKSELKTVLMALLTAAEYENSWADSLMVNNKIEMGHEAMYRRAVAREVKFKKLRAKLLKVYRGERAEGGKR